MKKYNMKKKIKVEVYCKHFDGDGYEVRFSDLPKDIQSDDIINIQREESYYSENDSYEAYTKLIVIREREETDEEYENRKKTLDMMKEISKERRYEQYLKLKEEFEK
jgi:hypothetical protein